MRHLDVLLHGEVVGAITERSGGRVEFTYADGYLNSLTPVPLSVSMPLDDRAKNVEAWLDGLLADNDNVRRRWAADYAAASTRPVDLLATPVGRDCAGAVQICAPESTSELLDRGGALQPLTEADVAQVIAGLRTDPAGWNRNRSRTAFSLGGAQAKTALRYEDGQWSLPGGAACTTHILKPPAVRFPDLDIVEHLCQRAARNLGLQTAEAECVYFDDERALVVQRYDREQLPTGGWARIHQEDMCQALGVAPHLKYQSDGGPTPHAVASLLREHSSKPDQDVCRLLDALIYNWLIVNTDAHAKNYGLLLDVDDIRFAPLYDLCSFIPYKIVDGEHLYLPKLKLAMKVGKDYTLRKADRASAWMRAADQLGVSRAKVAERISVLADGLDAAFTEALDTLPDRARVSPVVADMAATVPVRRVTGMNLARRLNRPYPMPAKPAASLSLAPETPSGPTADQGEMNTLTSAPAMPSKCGAPNKTKRGTCEHPHPGFGRRCAAGHQH